MDDRVLLIALLVFALVFQAAWLFSTAPESERDVVARRLDTSLLPTWEGGLPIALSVLRRRRYSRFPWSDALLARFDVADGLSRQLLRAGLPVRAGEFLFLQIMVVTLAGLIGAIGGIVADSGLLLVPLGMVLGFVAPLSGCAGGLVDGSPPSSRAWWMRSTVWPPASGLGTASSTDWMRWLATVRGLPPRSSGRFSRS